ncbi:uncharacterized protein LOC131316199 [Rhododendron vialii]|uniref:uncharacterized protein LOC131316199 n=1 Tax=Rhododendron vialii TaxID=182163 RepID=UPI00265EE852|nr:uncharacterized protein LOC131316199 [Rhododendron vialii]
MDVIGISSSSLPVPSSSLPVGTGNSSSLPIATGTSSSFHIELLCWYTSDMIEECAMRRRDGSCSLGASINKDVTFLFFDDYDRLLELSQCLNGLDRPNIPKVHAVLDQEELTLVVDRVPRVPVKKWLEHETRRWAMWTVVSEGDEYQYLELEEKHHQLFRCIARTLGYLHTKGICHGNLQEGVWVTEPTENNVRVLLTNFNRSIEFPIGFKQDLDDLKGLVEYAVQKHSKQIRFNKKLPKEPPALQAFYNLYTEMKKLEDDLEAMREFAMFIYWAPIFHDWRDRRDFVKLIEKFSLQSFNKFEQLLIFDSKADSNAKVPGKVFSYAIPELRGWMTKIEQPGVKSELVRLYNDGSRGRAYQDSGGIYWLHRCGLYYYRSEGSRDSEQAAMEDLLSAFPNAIPMIMKALIRIFGGGKVKNFRKNLEFYLEKGL